MNKKMPYELLKFKKVLIRVPFFDPNPEKTTTRNWSWRKGLFVILEDKKGKEHIWMPRWKDVELIQQGRATVELENKKLCKERNEKGGDFVGR